MTLKEAQSKSENAGKTYKNKRYCTKCTKEINCSKDITHIVEKLKPLEIHKGVYEVIVFGKVLGAIDGKSVSHFELNYFIENSYEL